MLNEYIQGTLPTHPYLSRCTLYTSVSPQLLYRKDLERIIMGKHKQAACEICFKHMRSDNLKRHYQNKHILSFFTSSSTKQTTEKCVRPCIQSRKKFKDGEAQRNGGGSYKHRPSQNLSQTQHYPSPKELNQITLYSTYRFKPESKLKEYLFIKTKVKRSYYMLMEIFEDLKVILRSEKLYDPKNPSIIMCDPDLEIALNMKDLHVTQIRDQILKQLTLQRQQNWRENFNTFISKSKSTSASSTPPAKTTDVPTTLVPDKEAKYIVNPSLMGLLRTECEEKDRAKAAFKFEEVVNLLFKYLIRRRDTLFDSRNIKVARVHHDPLGRALGGIARFHICQAENLLRAQLSPVNPVAPHSVLALFQSLLATAWRSNPSPLNQSECKNQP